MSLSKPANPYLQQLIASAQQETKSSGTSISKRLAGVSRSKSLHYAISMPCMVTHAIARPTSDGKGSAAALCILLGVKDYAAKPNGNTRTVDETSIRIKSRRKVGKDKDNRNIYENHWSPPVAQGQQVWVSFYGKSPEALSVIKGFAMIENLHGNVNDNYLSEDVDGKVVCERVFWNASNLVPTTRFDNVPLQEVFQVPDYLSPPPLSEDSPGNVIIATYASKVKPLQDGVVTIRVATEVGKVSEFFFEKVLKENNQEVGREKKKCFNGLLHFNEKQLDGEDGHQERNYAVVLHLFDKDCGKLFGIMDPELFAHVLSHNPIPVTGLWSLNVKDTANLDANAPGGAPPGMEDGMLLYNGEVVSVDMIKYLEENGMQVSWEYVTNEEQPLISVDDEENRNDEGRVTELKNDDPDNFNEFNKAASKASKTEKRLYNLSEYSGGTNAFSKKTCKLYALCNASFTDEERAEMKGKNCDNIFAGTHPTIKPKYLTGHPWCVVYAIVEPSKGGAKRRANSNSNAASKKSKSKTKTNK